MEKAFLMVVEQFPLKEREYTKNDGTPATIKSLELKLRDATDEFYCEATDSVAERLAKEPLKPNSCISAECRLVARKWQSQNGIEMHATSVRIINYIQL